MQLDVESLRTFLAVLDRGGMTRAAESLQTSQSSVSWRIKRLEERAGRPLLIRDGHDFRPSRDGRAILDNARAIVDLHDRAVAQLRSDDLSGVVRIGANEEVGAERIAALLGRFRRDHPRASVEVVVASTERLSGDVETGALDLAVMQVIDADLRPDDVVLWSDQLLWVTAADTRFAEGQVPLVTFGDRCFYRPLSEPLLAEAGIDHTVALSVATHTGVYAAVSEGLGVGVLGARHLGDGLVEWCRSGEIAPLPTVHQIVRTVPGERADAAERLSAALIAELGEGSTGSRRRPASPRRSEIRPAG